MAQMTFFEAALKVLQEAGGGPLHYREISKRAIASGYVESSGRTPEATLNAQISTHIKKVETSGQEPKIRQTAPGHYALSKKIKIGPLKNIEDSNLRIRSELHHRLLELHPRAFENLIGALLSSIGFENVVVLRYTGDGGLDIEAELTVGGVTNVKTAVQVKRWKNNVSGKTVRELRGGLTTDQRGLVITTSSFTKDARAEAAGESKAPISLIDGEKLLDLCIENQIGVARKPISYLELDLESLQEFEEEGEISPSGQALALWPVPGGMKKYVESTVTILRFVVQTEPTHRQMVKWMPTAFPKAKSEKTIASYIRLLKTLNLITFDGEAIKLTAAGSDSLTKSPREIILNQLRNCVAGITQFLDALEKRAMTLKASHEFFRRELSVDWETYTQTKLRLLWLENVGAIRKEDQFYKLT